MCKTCKVCKVGKGCKGVGNKKSPRRRLLNEFEMDGYN